MTKKILAFGASNSKASINKQLASYAANQLKEVKVTLLDLNDFEMPIYSIDREEATGIPQLAKNFKQHIQEADGILISFAEHNGAYTTAFKNVYDWMSRMEGSVWQDKPMLLMATSPGGRGGQGVLEIAYNSFSYGNKQVVGSFSLPSFQQNFSTEKGIMEEELKGQLLALLEKFHQIL